MPLPEAGRKGRCPGAEWRRARRSWTGAHGSGQQGPALGLSARQRGLAASGCGRRRAERKAGGNGEGRQSLKKFGSQGCLLSRRLGTQGVQVLGEGGGRLEERRRPKVPGGGAQGPAALAGGGGSADLVPGGPAGPSSPGFRRAGGRVSGSEERRGGGWPRAGVKQPNMGAAGEGEGCSGAPGPSVLTSRFPVWERLPGGWPSTEHLALGSVEPPPLLFQTFNSLRQVY